MSVLQIVKVDSLHHSRGTVIVGWTFSQEGFRSTAKYSLPVHVTLLKGQALVHRAAHNGVAVGQIRQCHGKRPETPATTTKQAVSASTCRVVKYSQARVSLSQVQRSIRLLLVTNRSIEVLGVGALLALAAAAEEPLVTHISAKVHELPSSNETSIRVILRPPPA